MRWQVSRGAYHEALRTLSRVHRSCIQLLDHFTFPIALKACTSTTTTTTLSLSSSFLSLRHGQQIHTLILLLGFQSDVYITNAVISFYSACNHLEDATLVFDEMPQRTIVTWNTIMSGCIRNKLPQKSISYFSDMSEDPDSVTISTLLHAHSHLGASGLRNGRSIHAYIFRRNGRLNSSCFMENALIDMYLKSSCLFSAEKVFQRMGNRDLVSWTTMISGYINNNMKHLALETFLSMLQKKWSNVIDLDSAMLVSVMPALGSLRQGKEIHCFAIKRGFDPFNVFVATSILHMYSEFGSIDCAAKQFQRIEYKNVVAWTAMITACAKHGQSDDCFRLFDEMRLRKVIPNHLTFMGLLTACTHTGLVEKARNYFTSMTRDFRLTPDMYHYAAMVDVLGRAGKLKEALNFIDEMPMQPTAPVWGALMSACGIHHDLKLGHEVAKILMEMEPKNPGNFVLFCNMLAQDSKWDDVSVVRETMKLRGLEKIPAYSSVHVSPTKS